MKVRGKGWVGLGLAMVWLRNDIVACNECTVFAQIVIK